MLCQSDYRSQRHHCAHHESGYDADMVEEARFTVILEGKKTFFQGFIFYFFWGVQILMGLDMEDDMNE